MLFVVVWEPPFFTFSSIIKQEMTLSTSIACSCSSLVTEMATAEAISEGVKSKKSIPALISQQALLETHYSSESTKETRQSNRIRRGLKIMIPLVVATMSCTDLEMDDIAGCCQLAILLRK